MMNKNTAAQKFSMLCQYGCGRIILIDKKDVLALKRGENLVCICCCCARHFFKEVMAMFSDSPSKYVN